MVQSAAESVYKLVRVRRSVAKVGHKWGNFGLYWCGWKTVGSAPIEKSFHSVANQRDECTIVLLLRSKRKFRMMNDGADLVKAGVESLMKPVSDIVAKIAGPAADELGLTVQDHIRVFRFRRQVRLFEQVKKICCEAGIEPRRVPLKLLAPIVENASLEEDNDLQDIWANLLTNAADPRPDERSVLPSFSHILKELTASDVKFLNRLYMDCGHRPLTADLRTIEHIQYTIEDFLPLYADAGLASCKWSVPITRGGPSFSEVDFKRDMISLEIIVAVLVRQGLVGRNPGSNISVNSERSVSVSLYYMTYLGRAFVRGCSTPKQQ